MLLKSSRLVLYYLILNDGFMNATKSFILLLDDGCLLFQIRQEGSLFSFYATALFRMHYPCTHVKVIQWFPNRCLNMERLFQSLF